MPPAGRPQMCQTPPTQKSRSRQSRPWPGPRCARCLSSAPRSLHFTGKDQRAEHQSGQKHADDAQRCRGFGAQAGGWAAAPPESAQNTSTGVCIARNVVCKVKSHHAEHQAEQHAGGDDLPRPGTPACRGRSAASRYARAAASACAARRCRRVPPATAVRQPQFQQARLRPHRIGWRSCWLRMQIAGAHHHHHAQSTPRSACACWRWRCRCGFQQSAPRLSR